jgi:hypothetical protein
MAQQITTPRTRRLYRWMLRTGLATVTLDGLILEMGIDPTEPGAIEAARRWIHDHRWCGPGEDASPSASTLTSASVPPRPTSSSPAGSEPGWADDGFAL